MTRVSAFIKILRCIRRNSAPHLLDSIDGLVWWNRNRRLPFIVCRPSKIKLRFSVFVCSKQREIDIFHYFRFLYIYIYTVCATFSIYIRYIYTHWKPNYIYTVHKENITIYIHICRFKQKTEGQKIFLNPFTVCPSCKPKFVVCLFVEEETNGNYLLCKLTKRTCPSMVNHFLANSPTYSPTYFLTYCPTQIHT
jgi:hypothetical protein